MPPVTGSDFRITVEDKGQPCTSPTLSQLVRHQAPLPPPKVLGRREDTWTDYGFTQGRDARLRPFVALTPDHIRPRHLRKRLVRSAFGTDEYVRVKRFEWETALPVVVYADVWDGREAADITVVLVYKVSLARGLVATDRRTGSPTLKGLVQLYHLVVDGLRIMARDFSALRLQWGDVNRTEKYFHIPSDASDPTAIGAILPPWITATGDQACGASLKSTLRVWIATHRARVDLYRTETHEAWACEWDKAFADFFESLVADTDSLGECVAKVWPIPTFRSALLKGVGPPA